MKKQILTATLVLIALSFWACKDDDDDPIDPNIIEISAGPNAEQDIQSALIQVEDGMTIRLNPGIYDITGTLTMDGKSNVTLDGSNGDAILSFVNQSDGGEGILISNSANITVKDLVIEDTEGDALKVTGTDGILIDRVIAVWTNGPSTDNGGYGLYPVLCKDVVIRNSAVSGASDSGIYVGQSENAQVYNNNTQFNVAGIEIENTINADVYDNYVIENTGGILVFDLPIPGAQAGSGTRVYNNELRNNNHDNFAPEGGIVALVPPGTGILVLATKQVEVFDNIIQDHHITGVAAFSYISIATMAGLPIPDGFDPFFSEVHIHDNQIEKFGEANPNQTDIGLLLLSQFAGNPLPDLLTDGIFSPASGDNGSLCIQSNGTEYFANLDMSGQPPSPSFDLSAHDCSMDPLPEVNAPG
jgi:parallel beta-helix repeat protein